MKKVNNWHSGCSFKELQGPPSFRKNNLRYKSNMIYRPTAKEVLKGRVVKEVPNQKNHRNMISAYRCQEVNKKRNLSKPRSSSVQF
jgi:hypothetical protein